MPTRVTGSTPICVIVSWSPPNRGTGMGLAMQNVTENGTPTEFNSEFGLTYTSARAVDDTMGLS